MARKLGIAAILSVVVAILPFINPLVARADTFQYSVTTVPGFGSSFQFSFTEPTLASSGDVTSGFFSITIPKFWSLDGFSWNSAAGGDCPVYHIEPDSFDSFGCAAVGYSLGSTIGRDLEAFTPGSFLAPGIFKSTILGNPFLGVMTVTITDVSVPEPSTLMLLGTGVLTLFGITRKTRFSLSCKQ